jgi:hypothetical protein
MKDPITRCSHHRCQCKPECDRCIWCGAKFELIQQPDGTYIWIVPSQLVN